MTTITSQQPIFVTFAEKQTLVEVRCDKGHLVGKITPKAVAEVKCSRCAKLVVVKAP